MAQTTHLTTVVATGWTRLDSLGSHTLIEVQNHDETQAMSIVIAGADPTAGVAWDTGAWIIPGGERMWRLATSDQVWARMQTGANTAGVLVYESL